MVSFGCSLLIASKLGTAYHSIDNELDNNDCELSHFLGLGT